MVMNTWQKNIKIELVSKINLNHNIILFKVALDTKSWEVELIQTFSVERGWNKIPLEIKSGSNYNLEEGGIEREG